jgi:putative ABC transport system ATP-binding protein
MHTTPAFLTATGLGRSIDDRWIWRDLSFALRPGEAVAVTGPSGSGKTLLLRALAGLDGVSEGEISLGGRAQRSWHMPAYRAQVLYLAQRPAMLAPTVEADLRRPFSLRLHRATPFPRDRALDLLATVGRDDAFLAQPSDTLSGGEGQIVALLRALLLDPRVLLLDEPTASLDDGTTRAIERLVTTWRAGVPAVGGDAGRAVVWTSHDDAQLERVTDGRIRLGTP